MISTDLPLFTKATFDGDTFDPFLDGVRLESQLSLVAQVMSDGAWWTIPAVVVEIARRFGVKCSDTGVSARIRDFRKDRFGGREVERRRVVAASGLYEYRVLVASSARRSA